jgi:hypothetical protein
MAMAEPIFFEQVVDYTNLALLLFALVIEVIAFGHCLVQRPDAFPAINTLPKGGWLALTGGAVLVTLLSLPYGSVLGLLGLAAIAIAGIYLLDVRPALRDAVDGQGPW